MLAQLYEDGPVLFERAEGSFGASQVACLEVLGVLGVVVALEDGSVAVRNRQLLCPLRRHGTYSLMFKTSVSSTR
jgi:hypothetical protein